MFKADDERYNIHVQEYMDFVRHNKRFPDLNDAFTTGTKMYQWRRYARNIVKDKNILSFDESVKEEIENNKLLHKNRIKNQRDYDEIIRHKRTEDDPPTYKEYMEGNNRYHYFDISTYTEIIRIIGNVCEEEIIFACSLKLFQNIYHANMSWAEFHRDYDMSNFVSSILKAVRSLSDRECMVITMRYGLENGHCMTMEEIAKEFYATRERIRSIEAKALRKLAHPKITRELKSKHEIHGASKDHWFIINIQGSHAFTYEELYIHRPAYETEELFATLYEERGIDVIDPRSEYKLRSVKTYNGYAYELDDEMVQGMNIPREDISGKIVYSYTIVSIDKVAVTTTEEYVEQQLEKQETEAGKEILITNSQKNHKEEIANMMFIRNGFSTLFQTVCSRTCKSINFDGGGKWIDEFNERMRYYIIPPSCIAESAEILRVILLNYLDDFSFTCRYIQGDDMYYYIHLECEE